ncbi:MAG: hypothetical protein AUI42_06350 [Actinobacteria bacterium 13_1_40CM_2_65_8]|nr:MAG: hypothetical protein AUI42_06350 [Actinobacteria bacterium 13_1_40CM_2_65_8]
MNPPPVQLAATALVPVNMSSVAITLCPGEPGLPWVADQDTIPSVTSCGVQDPVIVQMVRGCKGSVTSASSGWLEPWSVMRASWAAGAPEQVAFNAAQAGTATGLAAGFGLGVGVGVGVGISDGLGEALSTADGDGLLCVAVLEPEQPASASKAATAASRSPTGK